MRAGGFSMSAHGDVTTFSFPHFKFVAKEVTERLKVCSSASSYMDDLAELENALGKALVKIGKQPIEIAKADGMPGMLRSWDTAMKLLTDFTGKHHSNVSFVIAQNISKVLSDVFRLSSRRVLDITNKIKSQHHELIRSKQAHFRKQEKYIKSMKDAEVSIRQRYAALDLESKACVIKEKTAKDTLAVDENIMKSFSKMIAKIAPVDSQKRWNEKFLDTVKDLDSAEASLKNSCQQLNYGMETFLADIQAALEECKCLELSRIAAIKESLIELSHMQSSICDEDKNAYTSLCTAVEDLNIDEEVESLIWSVDRLVINDSTNDPSLMNDIERNVHVVSGDFYPAERTKNTSGIFHKVQKTLEVLDFLLKIVSSVTSSLKAVADAKKTYSKAMHKCFEKHGLVSPNSGPSLGCFSIPLSPTMPINQNRGVLSGAKTDGLKRFQSQLLATGLDSSVGGIFQELIPDLFSELLSRTESPSFVSLWLATVSAFGGISDAHNETAEKYNEIYLPTLNSIQRRVLAMKNELMTKQISSIKLIDNSQATVLKLSQKIEKARFLIKTQQEKVERSKEEVGLMSPSSAGGSSSPRRLEIDDDTEDTNSMKTRSVSPIPDDDNVVVGEINKDREKDDMKKDKEGDRIGKASKIMQQGLDQFGSRFQKARIKVLRSENQEDRLERREGRMVALELEEKDLLTTFYASNASMDFIEESVRREIDSNLKAAKEIICHDITSFMDILKQLSTNHRDCVPLFEIPVKAFETLCDCFDGQIELCHFTTSVQNAFHNPDAPLSSEEEKNPTVTHFTPLFNKAVEDEKALQGIFSDPNRSEHDHEVDVDVDHQKQNTKANVEEVPNNNHQDQDNGTSNDSKRVDDAASNTPIDVNVKNKSSSNTVKEIKDSVQKYNIDKNDVSAGPVPSPDVHTSQQLDPKGTTTQSDVLAADGDDVNTSIAAAGEAGIVKKTDLHIEIYTDKVPLQESNVLSSVSCPSADVCVEVEDSTDTTVQGQGRGQGQATPHSSVPLQPDSSAVKMNESESDGDASYDPYRALESSIKAAASMLSPEVLMSSLGSQKKALSDINTTENEDETEGLSRCARMTEEHVQLTKGFAEFQTKDLLIAELIRQKLLTDDAYSERAGDGMSGTSTACMSPTALPPRPPLPPRLRRSEGKDRSKDKDREKDKDKDRDREKGSLAADVGSPVTESSSTSVFDSPSTHHKSRQEMSEANRSPPIKIITEETPEKAPQLDKTGSEDDVKSRKTDVEKVIEVVESEGSMKTVCTTREIQDSPKVMRTTERVSHIGVDGSHVTVSNTTIGVNKKVPQSFGNKPEDSSELVKFGLSPTVRVLESFSCALYPKKGLLTHGRIFVTQHYLAFSGWPEMRLLLALKDINRVEKCNTLYYIPNGILVNSETYGEFFFGSFIDRDVCFALLNNMSQIAKRLIEIKRDSNTLSPEEEQLVFGLRVPKAGGVETYLGGIQAKATAGWNALPTAVNIQEISGLISLKSEDRQDRAGNATIEGTEEWTSDRAFGDDSKRASTTYTEIQTSSISVDLVVDDYDYDNYAPDSFQLSDLFAKKGIQSLCTNVLPFHFTDVLKSCWIHGSGYGDFLVGEGDLEIGYGDWSPLDNPKIAEDVSGLPFSYSRTFQYSHPRTTMLMFGPKNAPAKQIQYLYLPIKSAVKTSNGVKVNEPSMAFIAKQKVPQGVIMIITQFDGIPMADCFKIVQYFSFEGSLTSPTTTVRIGVYVHFLKFTVLKAQVRDGVKDELSVLSNKWCTYATSQVPKQAVGSSGHRVESLNVSEVVVTRSQILDPLVPLDSTRTDSEKKEGSERNDQSQKDKRLSRRLPKILLDNPGEKNLFIGALKAGMRVVFGFFQLEFENKLGNIFFVCLFVAVVVLWRQNGLLNKRLQLFESTMEKMNRALLSQGESHQRLLDTVHEMSQSELY